MEKGPGPRRWNQGPGTIQKLKLQLGFAVQRMVKPPPSAARGCRDGESLLVPPSGVAKAAVHQGGPPPRPHPQKTPGAPPHRSQQPLTALRGRMTIKHTHSMAERCFSRLVDTTSQLSGSNMLFEHLNDPDWLKQQLVQCKMACSSNRVPARIGYCQTVRE